MAWQLLTNYNGIGVSALPNIDWLYTSTNWQSVPSGAATFTPAYNLITWLNEHSQDDIEKLFGNNDSYCQIKKTNDILGYEVLCYYNGIQVAGLSTSANSGTPYIYIGFGIDEDNQQGRMTFIKGQANNQYSAAPDGAYATMDLSKMYLFLKDLEPVQITEAGAGSGYIGNSLLSNKKMVGYNVPTSSAESTKTESVNEVSASAVSGKPKSGNGFAKIKLIREAKKLNLFDKFKTTDTTHYKQSSSSVSTYDFKVPNDMLQYAQTDWIIFWGAPNKRMPTINDGLITFTNTGGASESCVLIPLNSVSNVISFELSVRLSNIPYSNAYAHVGLMSYDAIDGFSFLADTDLVYIYGDNVPSVNEWFTFKKYFSGVKADYLAIMYLIDGQHEIKDLKIEYLN